MNIRNREMFKASTKKAYDLGLVDKIPMNFKVPDKFFRHQKSDIYFASNEELEKLDKEYINHLILNIQICQQDLHMMI